MTAAVVARWESRNGRHWVNLVQYAQDCYGYEAPGCGGTLGRMPVEQAKAEMQRKVLAGYFLPDSVKTPMIQTFGG